MQTKYHLFKRATLIRCLRYAKIKTADLTYTSYRAEENENKGPEVPENERISKEKEENPSDTMRGGLKKTVLYQEKPAWKEYFRVVLSVIEHEWDLRLNILKREKNNSWEEWRFNYSSKYHKVCKRWEKSWCLGTAVYSRAAWRQAYDARSAMVTIQNTAERMAVWNSETQAMERGCDNT